MNKTHKRNCFFLNGQWLYKLDDPFRRMSYLPIDSKTIAHVLQIGQRTALRVCRGERVLSHAELLLLQFKFFGYVDDALFFRGGFHIRDGKLLCHKVPDYELGAGDILEFSLLRAYYVGMPEELAKTKQRLAEFENPKSSPPEPTNIISFTDYRRKIDK